MHPEDGGGRSGERELGEQLRFHAKMLDAVDEAVLTTSADGTVTYSNQLG